MAKFLVKVKNSLSVREKPRVYFTSHPDDLDRYFERITEDILRTHDCAIYYTEDMTEPLSEENLSLDLFRMNLLVVPVTLKLLVGGCRAMDVDIPFARENGIPILPVMMETGLVDIYSRTDRFGEMQFISPLSSDETEISYEKKLGGYLASVLINGETARRVRAAFDAYVFLSYRKKDRAYANELMRMIHRSPKYRDIAIWYDEFLTPGESFRENISRALSASKLFTLLVTPSLLEKPNFVMDEEYPAAKKSGVGILPVEMVETDKSELERSYADIPSCTRPDASLIDRLADMLRDVAVEDNDDDPEHDYLIGLAYYDGIDVEVDRERGIALIASAAEAGNLEAMERLFDIFNERGDYASALPWCERIYEHYVSNCGDKNDETEYWANALAVLYDELGYYDQALDILERLYSIQRDSRGEEHPDTLFTLNNIAGIYNHKSESKKSLSILERVLAISTATLGEESPDTIAANNNLAVTHYRLGNYEKAHALFKKLYAITCKVLGNEHPDTLEVLINLSATHRALGNRYPAISFGKRAYETMCRTLGEEHPTTLAALVHLATSHYEFGYYDDALELFNKAYTVNLELFGEKHPATLDALNGLAQAYSNSDFCNDALLVNFNFGIYTARKEVLGQRHSDTLISLLNLAFSYKKVGETDAAVTSAREAYEGFLEVLGDEHPHTRAAKELLDELLS